MHPQRNGKIRTMKQHQPEINSFPYFPILSLPVVLHFFLCLDAAHPAEHSTLSCFMARFTPSPGLDAHLWPVLFQILGVFSIRDDRSTQVSFMLQYNYSSYILHEILIPQTSEKATIVIFAFPPDVRSLHPYPSPYSLTAWHVQ